jgi:DNA-binding SARP family transcriptional activator
MRADIKILGTLEATVAGVPIVPTAPKQRQVLALLALSPGRVVTVPAMIDEIWGSEPPRAPMSSLQTYILNLRRKLERALAHQGTRSPKEVLVTGPNGYLLDIAPGEIDAGKYDQLAAAGRRAVNNGEYATASRILESALRLWRGPALVDVSAGPQLQIEVTRLEESRLSVLDLRIDADLRLGRHHQLLDELATLCARFPWLENFHAQYMLALYRSGRQWRSLEVYRQLAAMVAKQLGVEPCRRLRQLHQAILSSDPIVDDPAFVVSDWVPAALAR